MRTVVSKCVYDKYFKRWITQEHPLHFPWPRVSPRPREEQRAAQLGPHL